MSTAGKVLTILILLVTLGWVVILSAVTQLNQNWEQRIAKLDKDFKDATDRVAKANSDIIALTEATRIEQANRDRDLREVDGRLTAAERRQSDRNEDFSRLQIQLADYQAAVAKAETNNATRETERLKGVDDLAKKKDEIAKSQAKNAELRDQLVKLQDDFKRMLADNLRQTEQADQNRPVGRPASNSRPAPAS